jgi:hypothetical protein
MRLTRDFLHGQDVSDGRIGGKQTPVYAVGPSPQPEMEGARVEVANLAS